MTLGEYLTTTTAKQKAQHLVWALLVGLLAIAFVFGLSVAISKDIEITRSGVKATTPTSESVQRCDAAQKAYGPLQHEATEQMKVLTALATEKERSINERAQRRSEEVKRDPPPTWDAWGRSAAGARIDQETRWLRREQSEISTQIKALTERTAWAGQMIAEACSNAAPQPKPRMHSYPPTPRDELPPEQPSATR